MKTQLTKGEHYGPSTLALFITAILWSYFHSHVNAHTPVTEVVVEWFEQVKSRNRNRSLAILVDMKPSFWWSTFNLKQTSYSLEKTRIINDHHICLHITLFLFSNCDKLTIPLQLFTHENMEVLMKEALEDSLLQIVVLMIVEEIAKRRPEKLTPFIEQLTTPHLWNPNCSYTISNMLQYYAVRQEVRAE